MKQLLNTNIKLKISIGFMLAFLAFIGVQVLSNKSILNLRSSEKEMLNSNLLLKRIGRIESSVHDFESKIADFVCTGNKKFLVGNEDNLRNISVNLQYVLDASLSGEQRRDILRLDSLVRIELSYSQQTLMAYDKSNTSTSIALINTGESEKIISDVTAVSNRIQQLEENNLVRIISNSESYSRKVAFMDDVATAFAIVVILFSVIILFRDINMRVRVEQQLRIAQQKSEQSAIMKEQFMANMSHEIRTPMNAIIGFANLLSKSELNDQQKKHLSAIQLSGENLLTIINDILDFSKIEAGMVNVEKVPFNPASLLHSINVMFMPKAADKKIRFDFITSPDLPETVIGDPARLTQILVNLISNAMKFTIDGSISVKSELLDESKYNAVIKFTVKDTGIGIPGEKLNEIFERFTQANADTSRKYGGSGLGLSITKKLIELQGGTIRVESAESVGSSFSFFIPYGKPTTPILIPEQPPATRVESSLGNILVVEDNLLNQHLAESLLMQWGFSFDIVDNGKQAIEVLKRNKYDLILMDIQMPEMNGYDTAQFIRQELQLDLPIIAMTAHVLPGEMEKCLSFGMNDYISKPFRENELYNLISKYIGRNPDKHAVENNEVQIAHEKFNVINLDYVTGLSNGNPDFVAEMIHLFITENPKEICALESAIRNQNLNDIRALAHKIYSSVSFVGLNLIISDQLSLIENLAESKNNLSRIEELFMEVKGTCLKAIQELEDAHSSHAG